MILRLHLVLRGSPAGADTAPVYFFLPHTMLYRVRLQYALHIESTSKSDAFAKAARMLKENPGSAIAQIEQADAPKGNPSLLKRIITGK